IGQDIGGDALLGFRQQLAKMPAVAEHHVADDEQAPFVAQHLQREGDRATRPVVLSHVRGLLKKTLALSHPSAQSSTGFNMQSEETVMAERATHHATFVIEKTINAPPGRVFHAFADEAAKARWFQGPDDWEKGARTFDFRVGGRETSSGGPKGGPVHAF